MVRRARRLAAAALAVCLPLVVVGCEYKKLDIIIPGFNTYAVQGIHLWRLGEMTRRYQLSGTITFLHDASPEEFGSGIDSRGEWLVYADPFGVRQVARVRRHPQDRDRVTLRIWYPRLGDRGFYKASVYNAAGESPLSAQRVRL